MKPPLRSGLRSGDVNKYLGGVDTSMSEEQLESMMTGEKQTMKAVMTTAEESSVGRHEVLALEKTLFSMTLAPDMVYAKEEDSEE